MPHNERRVVVTGLGAVTPIGNDIPTLWESLKNGKSGAARIARFDPTGYDTTFACEVKNFSSFIYKQNYHDNYQNKHNLEIKLIISQLLSILILSFSYLNKYKHFYSFKYIKTSSIFRLFILIN